MEIKSRAQLVELMKHLGLPLTAVEVGCAEGIFSSELLQLGIEKLYLVDLWESVPFISGCASFPEEWHNKNYNDVLERMKDKMDKVTILKGFSYKMAREIPDDSLGLAYIDCDHTRKGVETDIDAYLPKLVKGGIMCFHDYKNSNYGVYDAVNTYFQNKTIYNLIENGVTENMGAYIIKS